MPVLPEKIIDFHVHLFPDELFEAIWRFFQREYGLPIVHQLYARECIEYLRERGVNTIVYSNYAHREGVAGSLNEWNLRLLDETDEIYCFVAFHPGDDDALGMIRRVFEHPKVLGCKLHFLVQRFYPHDERLFPLYEEVLAQGKRLLLHVGTGPIGNEYVGISHLLKVLKRYPGLKLNIAHMGAFEFIDFFELLKQYPEIHLDTSYCFLPGSFRMFRMEKSVLESLKGRLLYGSDFPNLFHHRREELNALLGMELSQEFYDRVFRDNALDLLRSHTGR
ncbi:MAG TPA: amidohydrolase family protein [Desulfomonilia bacterium]|nr:amidohydrolase family protein [Deltaproteobacteria bacterium]HRS56102.1 amidohydrolase family protein [Desulfomonilia bacterium]HRV35781.1 amidohydrolase family protein [Desulfomonilia bacterium]